MLQDRERQRAVIMGVVGVIPRWGVRSGGYEWRRGSRQEMHSQSYRTTQSTGRQGGQSTTRVTEGIDRESVESSARLPHDTLMSC